MQELQSLRSMVGKGTPGTGKVLMVNHFLLFEHSHSCISIGQVLCLFFAVLFGIWSPIVSKQSTDDFVRSSNDASGSQQKSLTSSSSSSSSSNSDGSSNLRSGAITSKSLLEQQDLIKQEPTYSNYIPNNYKSRVLLSFDEREPHNHGPYLPASNKPKLSSQQVSSVPCYTYSNTVERYSNKRFKSSQQDEDNTSAFVALQHCSHLLLSLSPVDYTAQRLPSSGSYKQSLPVESAPSIILSSDSNYKAIRANHSSNYRINEKVIVIENAHEKNEQDSSTFEGKPLKIIRVERTKPAIGNDTMKLTHRTVNE